MAGSTATFAGSSFNCDSIIGGNSRCLSWHVNHPGNFVAGDIVSTPNSAGCATYGLTAFKSHGRGMGGNVNMLAEMGPGVYYTHGGSAINIA
jgi:hypothetical protein